MIDGSCGHMPTVAMNLSRSFGAREFKQNVAYIDAPEILKAIPRKQAKSITALLDYFH
jgi:hypothetical protein